MPFVSDVPESIAIATDEHVESGCPFCGYRSGSSYLQMGGAMTWKCGECGRGCIVLAVGVGVSPIGLGTKDGETIYPEVQPHPRLGIPKRGREDKKPEGGGEFFGARGIGIDSSPGCFICGGKRTLDAKYKYEMVGLNNVAGFAQCKVAGARIVEMFNAKGCWMDYRDYEPDRIQVKIGACKDHLSNLTALVELTRAADGVITTEMIEQVSK